MGVEDSNSVDDSKDHISSFPTKVAVLVCELLCFLFLTIL